MNDNYHSSLLRTVLMNLVNCSWAVSTVFLSPVPLPFNLVPSCPIYFLSNGNLAHAWLLSLQQSFIVHCKGLPETNTLGLSRRKMFINMTPGARPSVTARPASRSGSGKNADFKKPPMTFFHKTKQKTSFNGSNWQNCKTKPKCDQDKIKYLRLFGNRDQEDITLWKPTQ